MKIYLVRLLEKDGEIPPKSPAERFIGVFSAQNVFELGLAVDEWLSPLECEYLEAPPGGVCWTPRYSPEFSEGWIPFVEEEEGSWREFGKRWLNRYFRFLGVWPESK